MMSRVPRMKELSNTRLANSYGGWMYCGSCQETIGYLCYSTYDRFCLEYKCKCGGCGKIHISFLDTDETKPKGQSLMTVKNRLCCPDDKSPLFTLLLNKLSDYRYEILCGACGTKYMKEKTQ